MARDIFSDEGNSNDKALGNDFIDLDDINNNGDFSEQEKNIAADGYNQEQGNIDVENEHEGNSETRSGFSDFDVMDDDNLNADMFPTGDEPFKAPPADPKKQNTQNSNTSDNDDVDEDQDFLNTVNKKYKTNFKTEKEFQNFLSKTNEAEIEEETVISDKDQQRYDSNKGSISYLDQLLQKEDEELVKEHYIIQFFQKNNRKPENEDLELIEEKIERMKDNVVLEINAQSYRNKYSQQKGELESFNSKIDEKVNEASSSKQKQNQQKLLNSYKDLYLSQEGSFMGVKLSTEDLQSTFNDVKSGEFVKRILSDPKLAATLSLVERKLEEIQKTTSQPGYSDGIEAILNKGNGQGRRIGSNTRTSQSSSGNTLNSKDMAFLQ